MLRGTRRCVECAPVFCALGVYHWLPFNACPKSGVSPPVTNGGAKKPPFWTTSQLIGTFNGLYIRNETRYRQSVKCVDNYKGPPTSSQNVMNFGPQIATNWIAILPILCKFCFLRHCQASQTDINKQNSTKLCQTADDKSR